jgi:hypothetical protein
VSGFKTTMYELGLWASLAPTALEGMAAARKTATTARTLLVIEFLLRSVLDE